MSVPVIASNEMPVVNHRNEVLNKGNLLDNVKIRCYGILSRGYLSEIFFSLLNLPVYYLRVEISNNNDNITILVDLHLKLETRDGRILIEYNDNNPPPQVPHSDYTLLMFTRYTWHSYFKYTWGFFNLTIDFTIRGTSEHTKLRVHGLVFGCGAVIFNPKGEVIGVG